MNRSYLKSSFFTFLLSFISFLILIIISISFKNSVNRNLTDMLINKNVDYPLLFYFLFIFITLISFLTGVFDLTSFFVEKKHIQNFLIKSIIFLFIFLFLPFYILFHLYFAFIKLCVTRKIFTNLSVKSIFKNVVFILFTLFILTPVWLISIFAVKNLTTAIILKALGYAPYQEYVAGTGSMYPTFPKGDKITPIAQFNQTVATPTFISYPSGLVIFNKRYFGRDLKRGDIVSFSNKKTLDITKKQYGEAAGFIKRVIALSGDTIELRGGIVYLNKKPLKEPYTAKPQSTFGQDFLGECKLFKIPKDSAFVMGDNRKGSGDSREIGFINLKDIDHVLPLENQKGLWDKNWRDTSKDFDQSSKITLNINDYLNLLNNERAKAGVKPLKLEPKLIQSANTRANIILNYDDFSFNATKSGVTMLKAMTKAGYSNIVYGEAPTQGYFESSELIDNQFQFPNTKNFLLNKDYQDFGISEVEGNINNCPTQVIVQHFAGYIPPNYPQSLIKSWEQALVNVNNIAKGWKELKNYPDIYNKSKTDIDRINQIIAQRQSMISSIVDKMHNNQWLTDEQNQYTKTTDKILGEEEVMLSRKINDLLK